MIYSHLISQCYKILYFSYFLFCVNGQNFSIIENGVHSNRTNHKQWTSSSPPTWNSVYLSKVQQILDFMNIKSDKDEDTSSGPTSAESYGYGFLCVFIISAFSLAGAVVFPFTKKPAYKYVNAFFIATAVGALFANTIFELIPSIVGAHFEKEINKYRHHSANHSDSTDNSEPRVPMYLWQLLILLLTGYGFYIIETMLGYYSKKKNKSRQIRYDRQTSDITIIEEENQNNTEEETDRNRKDTILSATFPNLALHSNEKPKNSVAWMIIIGDGIHNIADGLAIGASFADSIIVGVAQSIAIACQELPSELGEYMILIESGFTFYQALLFNLFSACTAFIGFFIGVAISENENARIWIFSLTAGTFIYIALVDLWPKLMPEDEDFDWIRFGCVSAGYVTGVFLMFGLGIAAEELVPKG